MNRNRAIDAWPAPAPSLSPTDVELIDPRLELGDQALVVASRNAFPIVASQQSRKDNLGLAAGGTIALVLGLATFASLNSSRNAEPAATTARSPSGETAQPIAMPPPAPVQVTPLAANPAARADPAAAPGQMPPPAAAAQPAVATGPAPVMVFDGTAGQSPAGTAPKVAGPPADMLNPGSGATGGAGAETAAVRSTRMADPANTVAQGTLITAVLETSIDSDLPGYVRAVVSQDVRSFDGSRVLVPRSSRLIGEYKSGLAAGQRRAYVMWTRLLRPDGVSVALASPATDFAGRSGLHGEVNDHFFSRFGSAILLSVLGGLNTLGSGGSTLVVSGGQSAASVALQRDGQRPPTIRVRQGEPVRIFTARDLVFTSARDG